jgi:hypothetical protein
VILWALNERVDGDWVDLAQDKVSERAVEYSLKLSEGGYESDTCFAYFQRHVLVEEM